MRAPRRSTATAPRQQIESMGRTFPQFQYHGLREGGLKWLGTLTPTPSSPVYEVCVVHRLGWVPEVTILHPKVPPGVPHRYSDKWLCLYWPDEFRWTDTELLAETIVKWTAFWLFYYEIWQLTGEWMGPESPHGKAKTREEKG